MHKPIIPKDEVKRIETLRALSILDTAPEERFDRVTRMATRLFGVPISLVSLVDEDRQWFKSAEGLDAEETPREVSFCGHAILGDDIFEVPNAVEDERFHDNPLVTEEPQIRFYAGSPLKAANGLKVGTLCLIDNKPRELSDEDKMLLKDLADMVEQEIAAMQLATLDELTMISNRRGFNMLSEHALAVCRRQSLPTTLLAIDLNDFKEINDTYGHAEGDRALVAFASLLKQEFRESDVFARIGGDEFLALLCGADAEAAEAAKSRFRQRVDEHNTTASRGYDLKFSIGTSVLREGDTIESLLKRADAAMYDEKERSKQSVH